MLPDQYDMNAHKLDGSPVSDLDYICWVLGYENPMDYFREQDACHHHRERIKKKSA